MTDEQGANPLADIKGFFSTLLFGSPDPQPAPAKVAPQNTKTSSAPRQNLTASTTTSGNQNAKMISPPTSRSATFSGKSSSSEIPSSSPPERKYSSERSAGGGLAPPANAKGAKPKSNPTSPVQSQHETPKKQGKGLEDGWQLLSDKIADDDDDIKPRPRELYSQEIVDECVSNNPENEERYEAIFSETKISLDMLRLTVWNYGIPHKYRAVVWRTLLGIVPLFPYSQPKILAVKREFYWNYARKYMKLVDSNDEERQLLMMIRSGLQNTALKIRLFNSAQIQNLLERVIYVWLKQNPTVVYHDGLTQVPLPIVYAFLVEGKDIEKLNISELAKPDLKNLEADVFHVLSCIFENGVKEFFAGSPEEHMVTLQKLIKSSNAPLYSFLAENEIQYLTFAYQWLESLFVDNIQKLPLIVQLWDRYIASGKFAVYHVAVCSRVIAKYSKQLTKITTPSEIYGFLTSIPMNKWNFETIEKLNNEACKVCTDNNLVKMPSDAMIAEVLVPLIKSKKRKRTTLNFVNQPILQIKEPPPTTLTPIDKPNASPRVSPSIESARRHSEPAPSPKQTQKHDENK